MDEVILCDTTYTTEEMTELLPRVGFSGVDSYPAWDSLPLYDAQEWQIYIAQR